MPVEANESEANSKLLQVWVTPALDRCLRQIARDSRVTLQHMLREALAQYAKANECGQPQPPEPGQGGAE